jgi:hypothetical protein
VESHPSFPSFQQCTSVGYPFGDRLNTALSLFIMYFLPLAIIIFSYGSIVWTLFQESDIRSLMGMFILFYITEKTSILTNATYIFCCFVDLSNRSEETFQQQKVVSQKTKLKTLKLTCCIVTAFFTCSTPYVVIATW